MNQLMTTPDELLPGLSSADPPMGSNNDGNPARAKPFHKVATDSIRPSKTETLPI
ncbi:MAG: hypothetical protein QW087_08095 [Methanomassiliicoccales archaeon]